MTLDEYLDATKAAIDAPSDYQLAKRLQISKQTISAYRTGAQWPDNYVVMKLAIALKADPATVRGAPHRSANNALRPTGRRKRRVSVRERSRGSEQW